MATSTTNVSTAKGVAGGYFFSAPIGTALPQSYDDTLDSAFVDLGFLSDDGLAMSNEEDSEDFHDLNGDTIYSASSSRTETLTCTLVETKAATLKEFWGQDNVTDENGLITETHTSKDRPSRVYVFDFVLRDGRRGRLIVCNGKVTEIGEETYVSSELLGREITVTANAGADGWSVRRFIESTETQPTEDTNNPQNPQEQPVTEGESNNPQNPQEQPVTEGE